MNFATVIVLLTSLSRTARFIVHEISIAAVKISGSSVNDLAKVCCEIQNLDGEICDPMVPANIRANLPVYQAKVLELRKHLFDLSMANIDAFSPTAQEVLRADLAIQERLASDRRAR